MGKTSAADIERDLEIWYVIEFTVTAAYEWCVYDNATYDTIASARKAFKRITANSMAHEYRIVRKRLESEVVR